MISLAHCLRLARVISVTQQESPAAALAQERTQLCVTILPAQAPQLRALFERTMPSIAWALGACGASHLARRRAMVGRKREHFL